MTFTFRSGVRAPRPPYQRGGTSPASKRATAVVRYIVRTVPLSPGEGAAFLYERKIEANRISKSESGYNFSVVSDSAPVGAPMSNRRRARTTEGLAEGTRLQCHRLGPNQKGFGKGPWSVGNAFQPIWAVQDVLVTV